MRYGLGIWPDGRVVGASPSTASVGDSVSKSVCFDFISRIMFQEHVPRMDFPLNIAIGTELFSIARFKGH